LAGGGGPHARKAPPFGGWPCPPGLLHRTPCAGIARPVIRDLQIPPLQGGFLANPNRIPVFLLLGLVFLAPKEARGQESQTLVQAQEAFTSLDYSRAAQLAQAALQESLSVDDRVTAYELLGYSYGILDQPDRAVATLSQMIVLDPEREPDIQALPPRLVSLYNQAFGQVLVVRNLLVDSTAFVAGEGRVTLHYEVSRPSMAHLRVVGPGTDAVIDSMLVNPGPLRYDWDARLEGQAVDPGRYQFIVTAAEGRNEYQRMTEFDVMHSRVDTIPFISSLEGFGKLPETEVPPRDWRPLGVSALLTGAAAGAALALNNSAFDSPRVELGIAAFISIGTGLALSLRQPEPRPVPAAIRYNELVDQSILDRNTQIAAQNEELRRRVRLTIVQVLQ
jgi:hypothetical protein